VNHLKNIGLGLLFMGLIFGGVWLMVEFWVVKVIVMSFVFLAIAWAIGGTFRGEL
jgi:hypothetical protein